MSGRQTGSNTENRSFPMSNKMLGKVCSLSLPSDFEYNLEACQFDDFNMSCSNLEDVQWFPTTEWCEQQFRWHVD